MVTQESNGSLPSSFRDPSGFLFVRDGELYRQVNRSYAEHYDRLMDSGLYEALVSAGRLIAHKEVDEALRAPEGGWVGSKSAQADEEGPEAGVCEGQHGGQDKKLRDRDADVEHVAHQERD